jgi:hypothetical protein
LAGAGVQALREFLFRGPPMIQLAANYVKKPESIRSLQENVPKR